MSGDNRASEHGYIFDIQTRKNPAEKPGLKLAGEAAPWRGLFLAVVADRLNRAAFKGFHALRDFLFGRRLLVHIGKAALVVPGKETRGGFTA